MKQNLAVELTESGYVPDRLVRHGIRKLLRQRLEEIHASDIEQMAEQQHAFIQHMNNADIALLPELANEQHYDVPQEFYQGVLGPHGKYSCCYWSDGVNKLKDAEQAGLELTCEHAAIEDGMNILELGCGWGSLTLWMADRYPNSSITAVSNSKSQGEFIRKRARKRGFNNVEIITADMNDFETDKQFDRVVSVEMFEHIRNYRELFKRIHGWVAAEGKFFMHIFVHRTVPYLFEDKDSSDWMSRYFFSGGMMPSDDLPMHFQEELKIEKRWRWNGRHYQKTSEAWLQNLDANHDTLWPVLENTYGHDFAKMWFMRWRMFFLAVAELFGYRDGNEWFVSHYLFNKHK
ncbi:MAG: cyclopropane-fatty-acyl-phospholipid synthase family protein [Pseudomonadales bacterium]|nr:cyclopropane-fatty-acyl-phospholipid synthase family protein [Pseudomonadales bacterium]